MVHRESRCMERFDAKLDSRPRMRAGCRLQTRQSTEGPAWDQKQELTSIRTVIVAASGSVGGCRRRRREIGHVKSVLPAARPPWALARTLTLLPPTGPGAAQWSEVGQSSAGRRGEGAWYEVRSTARDLTSASPKLKNHPVRGSKVRPHVDLSQRLAGNASYTSS